MKTSSIILLILIQGFCFAQSENVPTPFISSFKLYSGFNNIGNPKGYDISKIDKKASSFSMLDRNFALKEEFNDYNFFDFPYLNYYFNGSIEHKIKASNRSWFCGINVIKTKRTIELIATKSSETFESMYENGELIYSKDSVQILQQDFDIKSSIFSIENALCISTNQSKRFSAYFGLSTQIGFSISTYEHKLRNDLFYQETFHDSTEYDFNSDSDVTATNYLDGENNYYENKFNGKTSLYFSVNAFFGTNYRILDQENSHLYLFSEFKPGYAFVFVPEIKHFINYYNGFFSLFGLRYIF